MQFTELGLSAELLRAIGEQGYTTPTPGPGTGYSPHPRRPRSRSAGPDRHRQDRSLRAAPPAAPDRQQTRQRTRRLTPAPVATRHPHRAARAGAGADARTRRPGAGKRAHLWRPHRPAQPGRFGGVGINPQIQTLRRGIDILVATPGRLLDHLASARSISPRCKPWCWTKPTACSTWASSATSAASSKRLPKAAAEPDVLRHLCRRSARTGAHRAQSGHG
jgi:hypothetical protein